MGSVALMGTALSERQVELLKRYSCKAVIVLDGDEAGRRAAEKVAERLGREGFLTQVILLPQGEDPDSMVRREGTEEFRNWIEEQVAVYDPLERELVAAALLYPEAVYEGRRWVCLVCETLFGEKIEPELSFHVELLRGLERGEIPEELEDIAEGYRQEKREVLKEWLERDARGVEQGLFRLLVIYMEVRLEREVRWLSCRLRQEREPQEREKILDRLTARKELGAAVARWLERIGAGPVELSFFPEKRQNKTF
ncbi:MAG: toprim domain-containing protein [Bacteroides sp.]|nr:toprim domain-containing protein [Bacteroides sp.]